MYLLLIALYAIGIGAVGCAMFMFFVRMEKKKTLIIGLIGVIIIIGTMLSNNFRPSYENVVTITVEETAVTKEKNKDGKFACKVNDIYTMYQYFNEDKKRTEEFCSQFKTGESYEINYRFRSGTYTILEINKGEK